MLQPYSKLVVADNTGAKLIRVIQAGKNIKRDSIQIGGTFSATVKEALPSGLVKKKQVVRAMVIRQRKSWRRADGTTVRFDENAAVIINEAGEPIGTRIFGPVPRELRLISPKVISLAPEVV